LRVRAPSSTSYLDGGVIHRLSLVLLLFTLFTPACHRTAQNSDITFKYEVTPQPPRVGAMTIDLQLVDAKGQVMSGAHVETEGNMSHAGMSPVSGVAREIENGKYRVTLPLTMAGDWIILVNATLANGEHVQHQIELNGVRSD
jgi:hypothetical protein